MEDLVLLLCLLFLLIVVSFFLEGSQHTFISQSGIALIVGVIVGFILTCFDNDALQNHLDFNNRLFFDVLLPPIIYEAGFSVKRRYFFANIGTIMSTAILGTIIATCVTGGSLYAAGVWGVITPLTWIEAFLFGALISAVDPVATLACFEKLNVPPLLFNVVFGESVLNDAVVIALYQTLQKWKADEVLSARNVLSVIGSTFGMLLGSLAISTSITLLGAFMMNRSCFSRLRDYPAYEISLCLIISFMTYFVADMLSLSGIVSLFFSGTMTAHYHFNTISTPTQLSLMHLLHTVSFVCETLVFVFMGTSLVFVFSSNQDNPIENMSFHDIDWKFIGLTMIILFIGRLLNVVPLLGFSNCWRSGDDRISWKFMLVIWFAGLRGAISFALVKTWNYVGPDGTSHRSLIVSTTLIVVVFTTLIVGGLTGPLLMCLGHANNEENVPRKSLTLKQTDQELTEFYRLSAMSQKSSTLTQRNISTTSFANDENEDTNDGTISSEIVLTPRCSAKPKAFVASSRLARGWRSFDDRYLKPLFGGRINHHVTEHSELLEEERRSEFGRDVEAVDDRKDQVGTPRETPYVAR